RTLITNFLYEEYRIMASDKKIPQGLATTHLGEEDEPKPSSDTSGSPTDTSKTHSDTSRPPLDTPKPLSDTSSAASDQTEKNVLKSLNSNPNLPPYYLEIPSTSQERRNPEFQNERLNMSTLFKPDTIPSAPPTNTSTGNFSAVTPRVHPEGPPPSYYSICEQPKLSSQDRFAPNTASRTAHGYNVHHVRRTAAAEEKWLL
ncbi:hypothetical protein NQ318_021707, partial [Aromia moschata]